MTDKGRRELPELGTVSAVARAAGVTVDQAAGRIKHRNVEPVALLVTGRDNRARWALYDVRVAALAVAD